MRAKRVRAERLARFARLRRATCASIVRVARFKLNIYVRAARSERKQKNRASVVRAARITVVKSVAARVRDASEASQRCR